MPWKSGGAWMGCTLDHALRVSLGKGTAYEKKGSVLYRSFFCKGLTLAVRSSCWALTQGQKCNDEMALLVHGAGPPQSSYWRRPPLSPSLFKGQTSCFVLGFRGRTQTSVYYK